MLRASPRADTSLIMDKQVESVWQYMQWCLGADLTAEMCNPFWTRIAVASVAIGLLMLAWVFSKPIKGWLAIRVKGGKQAGAPGIATGKTTWKSRRNQTRRAEIDEIVARIKEEIKSRP